MTKRLQFRLQCDLGFEGEKGDCRGKTQSNLEEVIGRNEIIKGNKMLRLDRTRKRQTYKNTETSVQTKGDKLVIAKMKEQKADQHINRV